LAGLNLVGMKRNDISRDEIHALRNFYKLIFNSEDSSSFVERANKIATEFSDKQTVKIVTNFINSETSRSFCQPKN
jgi:UDP-N-acetylglucosamine acyltransferase